MIIKITGILEDIQGSSLSVRLEGGFTYEILVPAYAAARLGASFGQSITLHTLYYLQSENQGSSFQPRLAGFLTREDKAFFELLTTVKGIGNRKALRAMAIATPQIAAAIADRDAALLTSLPEIGRRTADTIIAELSGKVDPYLTASTSTTSPSSSAPASSPAGQTLARDAIDLLVSLGENRLQAMRWVEDALARNNRPQDVQSLISLAYQLKSGS